MDDIERTCSKCGVTKPLDRFVKHKACKGGYQRICKDCKNAYLRDYMANTESQRRKARQRKWEWRSDPENRAYENAKRYTKAKSTGSQAAASRRHLLKKQYGLTVDDYDRMVRKQGGGCAICGGQPTGKHKYFHVDHDHSCCPPKVDGERRIVTCGLCIRGLLCSPCNTALGLFRDDPALLKAAMKYLASPPVRWPSRN